MSTETSCSVQTDRPRRRSVRLPDFDYRQSGAYFVTICTHARRHLFGEIYDANMTLNEAGCIVTKEWRDIPAHRPTVYLDAFVVMPNHVHGIIVLDEDPATQSQPPGFGRPIPGSLASIVRSFKSAVTAAINRRRPVDRTTVWQRGFYERVIRDVRSFARIQHYIANNPAIWERDRTRPCP